MKNKFLALHKQPKQSTLQADFLLFSFHFPNFITNPMQLFYVKETKSWKIRRDSFQKNQTNLGPQQVARDETLELLLGSAPCDSSSLIIPCTT